MPLHARHGHPALHQGMGTNSAAKKREDARRKNGTFGHQHRDEPDTTIAWIAKQEITRVIDIDIDDPRLPHNADHVTTARCPDSAEHVGCARACTTWRASSV